MAATFNAILSSAPTAPVRINPNLVDDLEGIINKALEKDRKLRCQTPSELRADLQRLKRDRDSGRPHWFLSITYALNGRFDEAIAAAEKANELSGRNSLTLGMLGRAYGLAGRTIEARQLLE